jgi:DNA-binding NarL/FixJ family response regulator
MAIRTILIDDNPQNIALIKNMIDEIYDVNLVNHYANAESFLKEIKKIEFDLCIIDYHLPDMSGIQCIKRIPNKNIILTSHQTIPAHEAMAFDDITDVILFNDQFDISRLEKSIKRVRDQITAIRGYVTFKTHPNNHRQIELDDIVYISSPEKNSKRKEIRTFHEKIKTQNYTMDGILNKLPKELFVKVNEACIIHVNRFHSIDTRDFINININPNDTKPILESIRLTDTYRDDFKKLLNID